MISTLKKNYAVIPKVFLKSISKKVQTKIYFHKIATWILPQPNKFHLSDFYKNFGVFSSKKKNCYFQQN